MTDRKPRPGVTYHDDGDWATVEVELTDPMLEWIDAEKDADTTVQDWIQLQVTMRLNKTLSRHVEAGVEVEVPSDMLYPLTLKYQDAQLRGHDVDPDELLFNHIHFDVTWLTEHGNPIEWTTDD